jgi:hypothetical protein
MTAVSARVTTLGLAALALGCGPSRPQTVGANQATRLTWVARLATTVATGARVNGSVRITPTARPGVSRVMIELAGGAISGAAGTISGRHPWVIQSGNCRELISKELGSRAMYPLLEMDGSGQARINRDMEVVIPADQRYHVAVFASPSQRDVLVACGELAPII